MMMITIAKAAIGQRCTAIDSRRCWLHPTATPDKARGEAVSTGSFSGNTKTQKHTFLANKFLKSTRPHPQA
jgi:hypothetical protein